MFDEDPTIDDGLDEALRQEEGITVSAPNATSIAKARDITGYLKPIARTVGGAGLVPKDLPPVRDGRPKGATPGVRGERLPALEEGI